MYRHVQFFCSRSAFRSVADFPLLFFTGNRPIFSVNWMCLRSLTKSSSNSFGDMSSQSLKQDSLLQKPKGFCATVDRWKDLPCFEGFVFSLLSRLCCLHIPWDMTNSLSWSGDSTTDMPKFKVTVIIEWVVEIPGGRKLSPKDMKDHNSRKDHSSLRSERPPKNLFQLHDFSQWLQNPSYL